MIGKFASLLKLLLTDCCLIKLHCIVSLSSAPLETGDSVRQLLQLLIPRGSGGQADEWPATHEVTPRLSVTDCHKIRQQTAIAFAT